MPICGAPNKYPPPEFCHHRVKRAGMRCKDHRYSSGPVTQASKNKSKRRRTTRPVTTAQWVPPPPRPTREPRRYDELPRREQERVDAAAKVLADLAFDGWEDTVAGRVLECLDDKTWNRLFGRRRQRDCKALADAARAILEGKDRVHQMAGGMTGRLARRTS